MARLEMIVVRFNEMLAQKQKRDQKDITLERVALETELSYGTVLRWSKGQLHRADFPTLETLCNYFECNVGDLLVLEVAGL